MFHSLSTEPNEWEICQPLRFETDEKNRDIPIYPPYLGYRFVTPYFDLLSPDERDVLIRRHEINKSDGEGWTNSCQACGHGIIIRWQIKHDNKKYIMIIGSECIENFMEQDPKEIVKLHKTRQILDAFNSSEYTSIKNWSSRTVNKIWNDKKFGKKDEDGEVLYYSNGRMRLESKYHTLQSKLYRTNFSQTSYNELIKILKKVKKSGLDIPENVSSLIPINKSKKTKLKKI